ncbi:MAG: class I SAM-dependent methyltransferase, partial [Pirellulaceae bacterium]|nr:class I SAM-dependent methyltransferase [Pirellulaceae bacterium]
MLERVLEPEVMETADEAREYDMMDHSAVNQLFVDDLMQALDGGEPSADVLDLGCGTGQIPVALCEAWEECRVMATDLSINMLDLANYNIEVAGLTERILLQQLDAKELPCDDDYFGVVISNSIVHHLPDPIVALREAVRVTAPGGLIFFRDLLRPTDEATVGSLVSQYTGEESDAARKMFDESLRAALNLD